MGIPRYFHVITQTYPGIVKPTIPLNPCTDFFFDYNGAIHNVANDSLKEITIEKDIDTEFDTHLMNNLWTYTTQCIDLIKPTNSVHLCIDGVAPVAKLNQQRKRRFLSTFQKKHQKVSLWDRNAISPGTPFMIRLHAFLRARIRANTTLDSASIHLSTAEEPGEGEHKMFQRIHGLPMNAVAIVHGLDADLIMLSLMAHRPNIYLMREPSGIYTKMETTHGFLFVDIHLLRTSILRELIDKYEWPVKSKNDILNDPYCQEAKDIIEMYVVSCCLLGNDFLPHLLTISLHGDGHERILLAVKECRLNGYTNPMSVEFLSKLFTQLAMTEDNDLRQLNDRYLKKRPFPSKDDPMDSYPLEHKDPIATELFHDGFSSRWRGLYYKHMFQTKIYDTAIIANACKTYIQGIHWTYRYYTRKSKDPMWYYPWGYPPTLRDIANFLSGMNSEDEKQMLKSFIVPFDKGFIDSNIQLCCIMPLESTKILPKRVQRIMTESEHGCLHLFPSEYTIQTYLKNRLWECTPILPMFQIELIQDSLKSI